MATSDGRSVVSESKEEKNDESIESNFSSEDDEFDEAFDEENYVKDFDYDSSDDYESEEQRAQVHLYRKQFEESEVLTNGRFLSVRHKALTTSDKSRTSVAYFAAPPLHAKITALPEMITPKTRSLYRPFTWEEFKKAAYSLRLGDSHLDLFRMPAADEQQVLE